MRDISLEDWEGGERARRGAGETEGGEVASRQEEGEASGCRALATVHRLSSRPRWPGPVETAASGTNATNPVVRTGLLVESSWDFLGMDPTPGLMAAGVKMGVIRRRQWKRCW